jgi:cob(I)alamin adenosyltransferase
MNSNQKIYTRTGDLGNTTLTDNTPVSKSDPRIIAIGDLQELISFLALVLLNNPDVEDEMKNIILELQKHLFDLSSDISSPLSTNSKSPANRIVQADINHLEELLDTFTSKLPVLKSIVIPGGSPLSVNLFHACSISRRAERSVWAALHQNPRSMNHLTGKYLNRLSDLLFILSRYANLAGEEIIYESGSTHYDQNDYQILIEL